MFGQGIQHSQQKHPRQHPGNALQRVIEPHGII
jgi:hypothetical protein